MTLMYFIVFELLQFKFFFIWMGNKWFWEALTRTGCTNADFNQISQKAHPQQISYTLNLC